MIPHLRHRIGFSLIELLVVVSIIAVLAALLLPAMNLVRDMAATSQCASTMRQVGMYTVAYAAENEGLLPGGGQSTGSVSWCDILNLELLNDDKITLARMGTGGTRTFNCPRFTGVASTVRGYQMNVYAVGGAAHEYGKVWNPPSSRSPQYASWSLYYQGAPIARFNNPANKVLLQECMGSGDGGWSNFPQGTLTVLDFGSYKLGTPGTMAFRHGNANTANFLYMDVHIERLPPSGSLNVDARYNFTP